MADQPDRPKLTIDEQLDRLEEGHRSLAQSLASMLRENQKALAGMTESNQATRKMARSVAATARSVETLYAEHRLRRLEAWQRRLDRKLAPDFRPVPDPHPTGSELAPGAQLADSQLIHDPRRTADSELAQGRHAAPGSELAPDLHATPDSELAQDRHPTPDPQRAPDPPDSELAQDSHPTPHSQRRLLK